MAASIFAGGTRSGSGCDGRSASTEPNEGVPLLHLRQFPPLVGVLEIGMMRQARACLVQARWGRKIQSGPPGPCSDWEPPQL